MDTALAQMNCEAPNTVVAGKQKMKAGTGAKTEADTAEGFKKKLEDCVAVVIPMQTAITSGSVTNTDNGMQKDSGTMNAFSGGLCIIEGLAMPDNPSDVTENQNETADMAAAMASTEGMAEEGMAGRTSEPIAWTQNTTAGDNPVQTQDQILETVGAYLDASSEAAEQKPGILTRQAPDMYTPVSPEQPAAKVAGFPENTAEGDALSTQSSVAVGPEEPAMAMPETVEKRDAAAVPGKLRTDSPDDYGPLQGINVPERDLGEAVPVAKDVAIEVETHEAAQYTKENVLRIVDKVSTQSAEGRYDFDVELKPDFLGKVRIKLTMEDGSIRMQIKTDDMSVKGMLSDQVSSLKSELNEKGITLTNVDIMYENQASSGGSRETYEQNGGSRQGSMFQAQPEAGGYEPTEEPYSYYIGNSSVEFLA